MVKTAFVLYVIYDAIAIKEPAGAILIPDKRPGKFFRFF
jgi:hypothetical protein